MAREQGRRPTPRARGKAARTSRASAPRATSSRGGAQAPRRTSAAQRRERPQAAPRPRPVPQPKAAPRAAAKAPSLGGRGAAGRAGGLAGGAIASAGSAVSGLAARLSRGQRAGASAPSPREQRARHQRGQAARVVALVAAGVGALVLVGLLALFLLRDAPVFEITSVEVEPTQHVTADDVANLVQVPAGSTLLNVDTSALEQSLKREPWVGSVSFERVFPGTLKISITEQEPDMLVVMSSGSVGWYLGTAGTWIEPAKIEAAEGQSVDDAALALAQAEGCLLVTDVPATVDPEASAPATDAVLDAIDQFREGFSADFSAQIVRFSAPSPESVSCTLKSGVEVSLGAPTDITEKEAIVSGYLEQHPDSLVSINVRVVSNPAYREIASENVQQGDGVTAEAPAEGEGEAAGQSDGSNAQGNDAAQGDEGAAADGQEGSE